MTGAPSALGITSRVRPAPASPSVTVAVIVTAAWAVTLAADATGIAGSLHHHALIEGGPPLPVATLLFLAGWIVMVAAMMLPASLPTIGIVEAATKGSSAIRRTAGRCAFLGAFTLVWVAFGLVAFLGDDVLHHIVDATPALADRPWLISAGVLSLAGVMQFAPRKRSSLAACRHPGGPASVGSQSPSTFARFGIRHGMDCLGASWALMLLMFAEGFANPWWMVALTALMVYEVRGRDATRAVSVAGVVLLVLALATLTGA